MFAIPKPISRPHVPRRATLAVDGVTALLLATVLLAAAAAVDLAPHPSRPAESAVAAAQSASVHAQGAAPANLAIRLTHEDAGSFGAAEGEGDLVYLARHSRLVVVDATAPADAPPLGESLPLAGRIGSLAVRGGFVLALGPELVTLDARDPTHIQVLSRLPLARPAGGRVHWIGNEAWIEQADVGILRIGVRDLRRPSIIGRWRPESVPATGKRLPVIAAQRLGAGRAAVLLGQASTESGPLEPNTLLIAETVLGGLPAILGEVAIPCCGASLAGEASHVFVAVGGGRIFAVEVDAAGVPSTPRELPLMYGRLNKLVDFGFSTPRLWTLWADGVVRFLEPAANDTPSPPIHAGLEIGTATMAAYANDRVFGVAMTSYASAGLDGVSPRSYGRNPIHVAEVESAPLGVWAAGLEMRTTSFTLLHAQESEGQRIEFADTGLTLGYFAPLGSMASWGERLHFFGPTDIVDASMDPTGRITIDSSDPNRVGPPHLVSTDEDQVFTIGSVGHSTLRPSTHVRTIAPPAEPATSMTVPNNVNMNLGGLLDGDTLWFIFGGTGAPLLRAYHSQGPDAGHAFGFGLRLRGMPTGLFDATDGRLVLATGPTLAVVDVSDPLAPRALGEIDMPGTVTAAEVDGSRIWVAWEGPRRQGGAPSSGGLSVVTMPDRATGAMAELAHIDLGVGPMDVAVSDGDTWVASSALQSFVLERVAEPEPGPTSAPTSTRPPTPTVVPTLVPTPTPQPELATIMLPWAGTGR